MRYALAFDLRFPHTLFCAKVELAIVIGKPAKDVSEADALDYVLGYTAANDVSKTAVNAVVRLRKSFADTTCRRPFVLSSRKCRSGGSLRASVRYAGLFPWICLFTASNRQYNSFRTMHSIDISNT